MLSYLHVCSPVTPLCDQNVMSRFWWNSVDNYGPMTKPRTSTSHLATDHGSRPPAAQSRSGLSLATRSGPRTMEATRGNGYAPVRGMPAMMMMNDQVLRYRWQSSDHNQQCTYAGYWLTASENVSGRDAWDRLTITHHSSLIVNSSSQSLYLHGTQQQRALVMM